MHAQRRSAHFGGRPGDVVHPSQRERRLIARAEPAAAQFVPGPAGFVQRAAQQSQGAQGAGVVVKRGGFARHPTDQPGVEFVVAAQPNEPSLVGRDPAGRQEVVVAAAQDVVGVLVGDVQEIGQAQSGGTGHCRDRERAQRNGGCGHLRKLRRMKGESGARAVRPDNTPECRSLSSRQLVLHIMSAVRWVQGLVSASIAFPMVLAGCSSSEEPSNQAEPKSPPAAAPPTPAQIEVSPGGVTTAVNASASSTEEEYYQACHWAREWMRDKPGDPQAQIEPYLAMVQASATGENGTWNTPWTELTPQRQAGVIVAAKAAAEGGCD